MTHSTPKPTQTEKLWLTAWKIAGAELERRGREELANLSEEEGTRQATYLGVAVLPPALPQSGLLHWQLIMKKMRARQAG